MVASRKGEEAVIRRMIEDWASAVRAKNIGAVIAHHTDDMVMFDVPPPVVVHGLSAYRRTWSPFFKWQKQGNGTFDIVELDITAGDTVAFATAVLRCGSKAELAKDDRPRLRLTIGLRKVRRTWKIAHEHHSFPADG
jgi:ketosteroid isomerase-like protein